MTRSWGAPGIQDAYNTQHLCGISSPPGSDQGQGHLAVDFALRCLASSPHPRRDVDAGAAPAHPNPPPRRTGRLTWDQGDGIGWGGSTDWRRAAFGDAGAEHAGLTLRGSALSADEPVDRLTVGPAEAARAADGGLDAAADDNDGGVGDGCYGHVSKGSRRALLPLPYVRPRRTHGNGRHGGNGGIGGGGWGLRERRDFTAGECRQNPHPSGLGPGNQATAWLTDEDSDSGSSDSDQLCQLSGEAAWARCWRLAPQMAGWAAGPLTGAGGSDTTPSASALDPGGSEGCAAVDRVGGGKDEAKAGIRGPERELSQKAENAGDCVDMALHEFHVRCATEPPFPCAARWNRGHWKCSES